MDKIGLSIITHNRPDFFKQAINSVPDGIDLYVVNTGDDLTGYTQEVYKKAKKVHEYKKKFWVGIGKNQALRMMLQDDCDYLFLMEDDVVIKNSTIFETYIKTAKKSGLWTLNYGGHGNYNRNPQTGDIVVKNTIDYDGIDVDFYHNILGAFTFFHKGVIKNVGYHDEIYKNAFEHVDLHYRCILKGIMPPFWCFPDIHNSWEYIDDIKKNFEGSEIRKNKEEWAKNLQDAIEYFKYLYGCYPQDVKQTDETKILQRLEEIKQNYSKKDE